MKDTTTIVIDFAKEAYQVAVFTKFGEQKSNKAMKAKNKRGSQKTDGNEGSRSPYLDKKSG